LVCLVKALTHVGQGVCIDGVAVIFYTETQLVRRVSLLLTRWGVRRDVNANVTVWSAIFNRVI
jgi:hypothetical protein